MSTARAAASRVESEALIVTKSPLFTWRRPFSNCLQMISEKPALRAAARLLMLGTWATRAARSLSPTSFQRF